MSLYKIDPTIMCLVYTVRYTKMDTSTMHSTLQNAQGYKCATLHKGYVLERNDSYLNGLDTAVRIYEGKEGKPRVRFSFTHARMRDAAIIIFYYYDY